MDLELHGKRALVTGGSRGIGKATARSLAGEGVSVVIAARQAGPLRAAAAELAAETGGSVHAVVADTGSPDSVISLVERAEELLGGVDILVNNAAYPGGHGGAGGPVAAAEADLQEDFNVKVLGYLRCAQAVAPQMIELGWGRIINVGGLAARQSGMLSASIRNVAVAALSKNLADALGDRGINVNTVHPGATWTEALQDRVDALEGAAARDAHVAGLARRVSVGRIVDASEVAAVITFLASPWSVAINGASIDCGGGTRGSIYY